MALMTAAAVQALDDGVQPVSYAEIDLPDGSTLRVSNFGGIHDDRNIKPFVPAGGFPRLSFGSTDRAGGRVELIRAVLSVTDPDGSLAQILRGANGRNIYGSAARIKAFVPGLDSANDFFHFNGIVLKADLPSPPFVWAFTLRLDIEELRGDGHRIPVTLDDFPTAPDASVNQVIPVVMGVHDSTGTDATGRLSTIRVSTDGDPQDSTAPYRYVVSEGRLPDVQTRWVDGASQASLGNLGVNWFWTLRNGKVFTEVGFASDPGDSVVVTVDAYGLCASPTPTSDPSDASEVVQNPVEAIRLYLTNWVFNRWNDGSNRASWLDPFSSAPIDQETWISAAAFLGKKSAVAKRAVPAQSVETTLTEWFHSFFCGFQLTEEGNLGMWINDVHTNKDAIYAPVLYRRADLRGGLPPMEQDAESVVSRVRYSTDLVEATSEFLQPRTTADPSRSTNRELSVAMHWSGAAS